MIIEYTVIYERGKDGGWGAYAPDLPGLGVAAETFEEVEKLIREGIAIHTEALKEDGLPMPEPRSFAGRIAVQNPTDAGRDPLLALAGAGTVSCKDESTDEFVANLRKGWDERQ
jgi:predicted RNase H-like HicB family nuclease